MPRASHVGLTAGTLGLTLAGACFTVACARDPQAMTLMNGEQAGVAAAVIPVTLPDGRRAQLLIPQASSDVRPGLVSQAQPLPAPFAASPIAGTAMGMPAPAPETARVTPVARRATPARTQRTWEREALIIGGSAGAGTLIGALAGGGKGAAIGAAAGGVSGLVYDLTTRNGGGR